ncbi:subclass B1 metallo-beta-lactamase [Marinigracilibium pacificum]|uniref:beta-lactamase n=1 Tax=Marinigracilibium pacificum TaxID=2729599 RepID=A0A848IZU6_9BACT|nr:subclass B1 metallo-beta-lactamase [Marinigracilibium pacificum]NMM47744.1 subclass B1 metallo-beta-lactamase [Marinigracilibium pacificum]
MKLTYYLLIILSGIRSIGFAQNPDFLYQSENVKIEKLTENTYRHISYLETDYGKVGCNGMIVVSDGEALVFDTPTNDRDSKELIKWIENTLNVQVKGVIVTHFHDDCLGGLKGFHDKLIPSYSSFKTIDLAKSDSVTIPQNGFEKHLEIKVGSHWVTNEYFGEGHTIDNIVSYFPKDKVMFGGCLIKSLGAGKGYLGDANTAEWSNTVRAIKKKYGDIKVVIPGHGNPGDIELLDYTIEMFKL